MNTPIKAPVKRLSPEAIRSLVYTPRELAKVLHCGEKTIYQALKLNQIPHTRIGRNKILISKEKVREWLNATNNIPKSEL